MLQCSMLNVVLTDKNCQFKLNINDISWKMTNCESFYNMTTNPVGFGIDAVYN